MPTLYSMANKTRNRNKLLEMCKFRILFQLGIMSTILYWSSPNFACDSEMWSLRRLLFVRQTGSSLPILEMCGFRFWQYSGPDDHIFQQMSTKSHVQIKFGNADFVLNGEWNRNRNRILEMCKFRIWIRLGITPTILYRFSPNFACSSEMWSLRRLLFVRQTGSSLPILEMCGCQFWQFSGSGDYISNADFVINGEWKIGF